ncbi:pentatricopeptide repeat-containing protein At5g66500, mitochondrial [Mercurialis annua]|uniref:pentatricopeptide repeat-containing protein At5g66500, mitochondrial n=1 Tax=Mercurialis annua TaxID=3986 RepID=UPI00215DF6CD|nr:pentatricopeptide repeat-containing protein At5g66500, mitochondrial [Mercurialis annua]
MMLASARYISYLNFPAQNRSSKAITYQIVQLQDYYHTNEHQPFDEIPHRDIYSLNSQLARFSRRGSFLSTWDLFYDMHSSASVNLDAYTFTPVLTACSALPNAERGKQVHALMVKIGTHLGTITKTALIDMYSKYGYLDDSVKAFEEVEFHDVVTWNSLLSSFLRHGLANEALCVFRAMRRGNVEFTEFTLCSVLKACASVKAFLQGKQVHGLVVVIGRDLVVLGTALIDFYSSLGRVDEALKVYTSLSSRKDYVMCNSLIAGCIQNNRYREAFSMMRSIRPNVVSLTSALIACSENSDLWMGRQIHCIAIRFGFMSDTQLCNKLIDTYGKCGKITTAKSLFDRILLKDLVSWTSMIDAYGRAGHGHEGLELFKKMGESGNSVSPNSVTFLAVLSACGHSGLVEESWKLFHLMRAKYGIEPGVEHYSCFIDSLGRAGKIEDAWCVFHDMEKKGVKPTSAIWAALLNACSANVDVSGGAFAAKKLLELEPTNAGNYVMLSKFYASIGRWDSVDSLRRQMSDNALIKEVGSSWVTAA